MESRLELNLQMLLIRDLLYELLNNENLMKKKLIVLIPAYNEEKNISWVLKRIPKIENYLVEILVINDGSKDNTAQVAEQSGAIVINHIKNLGLGRVIQKGLFEAMKRNADIIVTLDSDGQYDPIEIPNLIREFEKHGESPKILVLGARLQNIDFDFNSIKKLGNKLISYLVSFFISKRRVISDTQTGFRVISRELGTILVRFLRGKYTYTQEMIILAKLNDYKIIEIPIRFHQRRTGESRLIKNPFIYLIKIVLICARAYISFKLTKRD